MFRRGNRFEREIGYYGFALFLKMVRRKRGIKTIDNSEQEFSILFFERERLDFDRIGKREREILLMILIQNVEKLKGKKKNLISCN